MAEKSLTTMRTPNWTYYDASVANPDLSYMYKNVGNGTGSGLKNWWAKNSGKFLSPGAKDSLKSFTDKLSNPQFNWNSSSGIQGWGKNLGKGATALGALYNVYNIGQNLDNLSDAQQSREDMIGDIVGAAYNNPMIYYDLTSDQMSLLRKLRNGSYDTETDLSDVDWGSALKGAVKGGVGGFVTGGIPGAVIGAIGSGANSATESLVNAQGADAAELEALYNAILASERSYNDIQKQKAYARLMQGY